MGNAKLTWKVDWAAKWKAMGVHVEGGGKDHSTKGGARDVANTISREVFEAEPPFDIPYEFFLVGGKKMSSSKGRGSSAREMADIMPPHIFRLALLGKDPMQAFNFDPGGDTLPVLFDQYDKLAENYWNGAQDAYARLFVLIHPPEKRERLPRRFLPRFSQVAFLIQMPHLDIEDEVQELKGSLLTEEDKLELMERVQYAKAWLTQLAPEKFKFELKRESVPEEALHFSTRQKEALRELLGYLETTPSVTGEDLHSKLHEIKTTRTLEAMELFGALYLAFLGKPYGPKAGWFLSVLDRDFLLTRLKDVVA
jgi:lysyl-tRNA synthetase class 1